MTSLRSGNAAICAPSDQTVAPPQQRIAACTALIDALKDQPQALAEALTNRGTTNWYILKTDLAFKDLGRAIAVDPKNSRAWRERSNIYRSIGRIDHALIDANEAVRLGDVQAYALIAACRERFLELHKLPARLRSGWHCRL